MRVAAVIPARMGSERLPGKPLLPIAGIPMVVRVWKAAADTRLFDSVVVATDDVRIADTVRSAGGRAVMTSGDHRSGTERCAEAAQDLGADVIVNVQGDQPFVSHSVLSAVTARFSRQPQPAMVTVAAIESDETRVLDPNVVKVVRDVAGRALYFSRSPIPFDAASSSASLVHIGIYGYRADFLSTFCALPPGELERRERLEQLRALEHGHPIEVALVEHAPLEVNTAEDHDRANSLAARLQ